MAPDRIFPDSGNFSTAPPPPGSYDNKDQYPIPPPATYRERRRGRSPCCCCLLWLCSILTILVFLIGLAVLIIWLVVQPKAPKFEVNTVHIDITGSSPINSNISYQITATNPNKKIGFYYSDIFVKVEANGNAIGNTTIGDFYQGHKNDTSISGDIISEGVVVSPATLTALTKDLQNVPFYAQVDLKAKIKVGAIKTWKIKIKVECNIYVDMTRQTGSQLKSSGCKVKW